MCVWREPHSFTLSDDTFHRATIRPVITSVSKTPMEEAPAIALQIQQLRVLGGFDHAIPDEVLRTALKAGGMDLKRAEDM
jgi:hypothetical protein